MKFSKEQLDEFDAIRDTILKTQKDGQVIRLRDIQNIQLEILIEIKRICKKHNIPYFLEAGTLLGAIRHGGFIPWDDDLDIDIMKEDYYRLIAALDEDLDRTRFEYHCFENNKYHNVTIPAFKVRRKGTYAPEPFHFAANHTKMNGLFVDIFLFDYCSGVEDKRLKKYRGKSRRSAILISALMLFHIHPRWLKRRHFKIAEEYHQAYRVQNEYVCSLLTWTYTKSWMYKVDRILPTVEIPFESIMVSAPNDSDNILSIHFGDYNRLPGARARRYRHINVKKLQIDFDVKSIKLTD